MGVADNLMRAVLLTATVVSFYPQLRRVISRGDSSGISLWYFLLIAISAIEQFTIYTQFLLDNDSVPDTVVRTPPTLGDWLDFGQVSALLTCTTYLLVVCVYYPPSRPAAKWSVTIAYLAFASISLVPIAIQATPAFPDDRNTPIRFSEFFLGVHCLYINLPVTIGILISLFFQAHETCSRPSTGALSIAGLAIQAIVFTLVAASWVYRIHIDEETIGPWGRFAKWYMVVGWAPVDNALFAIVQAILLLITRRGVRVDRQRRATDETTPLLVNCVVRTV